MSDASASSSALPEGVVFDCDGTIADTESLSEIAWRTALQARGYDAGPADFAALVGRPFAVNWAHFSTRIDLGPEEEFLTGLRAHFRALFDEGLEIHADAVGVIQALVARGVPVAVASSSRLEHVERVLDRAGIADLVAVRVGAQSVTAHKPHPAPYLEACRLLGAVPARTSAVEDTPTGADSARAAGLWTVAVRRRHASPELGAHADLLVDALRLEDVLTPHVTRTIPDHPRRDHP